MDTDCGSLDTGVQEYQRFFFSSLCSFSVSTEADLFVQLLPAHFSLVPLHHVVFQAFGLSPVLIFCTTRPPPPWPYTVPSSTAHTAQASAPSAGSWHLGSSQKELLLQCPVSPVAASGQRGIVGLWEDACRAGRGSGAVWCSGWAHLCSAPFPAQTPPKQPSLCWPKMSWDGKSRPQSKA